MREKTKDIDPQETQEWLESIEDTLEEHGNKRACLLYTSPSPRDRG